MFFFIYGTNYISIVYRVTEHYNKCFHLEHFISLGFVYHSFG